MKKRLISGVLMFLLIGWSVMVWPVSAEPMDTEIVGVVDTQEVEASSTNSFTLSQTKKIMGVGTTATLSTVPSVSAIWTSSDASIASVHPTTGVITAHKKGRVTIEAYYMYWTGETCTQSCQVEVLNEANIENETYWIAFSSQKTKCISSGLQIITKTSTNANGLKWQIQNHGDYYTFKSVTSNMYMGISMCYSTISDLCKWKIYEGRNGDVDIIAPYNDTYYGGMVLSPTSNNPADSSYVGLQDYFDTSVKKGWDIQCINTYVDNYYDVSFLDDSELRGTISAANILVNKAFRNIFNRNVFVNSTLGYGTYYSDLTINTCGCGVDNGCNISSDHSLHHKDTLVYKTEVGQIEPGYKSGIVVMWADRPINAYCYVNNGVHANGTEAPAKGGGGHVYFYSIRQYADGFLTSSSAITLLHEITHCFDLHDVYGDDHDSDGSMECVMEYFDGREAYDFYLYLKNNNYALVSEAYCPSCLNLLDELVEPS